MLLPGKAVLAGTGAGRHLCRGRRSSAVAPQSCCSDSEPDVVVVKL